MYLFEAQNIDKAYGKHIALDNVSLKIKEGTIYGLLGPNGAGKTSLIRIFNQITAPDAGQVLWQNQALKPIHTNFIGYLPEERGLYKKMKVGEHGIYIAQLKGVPLKIAKERLKFWFEKFEIESWWNKNVDELSKGMQQKVQFILTVIHQPKLFIFDEPFSGFDPINTELLKNEILNFKKNGASIILSTHNMSSVEELCDDMLLLNKSKTILQGKVSEIKNSFKENIIEVHVSELNDNIENIIPKNCQILKSEIDKEIIKLQVKIPEKESPNSILYSILNNCRVHAFFELLPTLNEIFIKSVNNSTNNNFIANNE